VDKTRFPRHIEEILPLASMLRRWLSFKVKWLRTACIRLVKLPDDLLNQQEVQAIIATAICARDKALIASPL
jgi:hypothetical protein